jgi:hypothetical protein
MSTDHYYESGVEELNCDIISGLQRPLVPKSFPAKSGKPQTPKNSQTVVDRQVKHKDTNKIIFRRSIE